MSETTFHKPARSRRSQEEKEKEEEMIIQIFGRWANTEPDDLLDRFFIQCALEDWDVGTVINEKETRWVITNLEVNPSWKQRWRELESEIGQRVELQGAMHRCQKKRLNGDSRSLAQQLKNPPDRLDKMDKETFGPEHRSRKQMMDYRYKVLLSTAGGAIVGASVAEIFAGGWIIAIVLSIIGAIIGFWSSFKDGRRKQLV